MTVIFEVQASRIQTDRLTCDTPDRERKIFGVEPLEENLPRFLQFLVRELGVSTPGEIRSE
jgi:hypothetical protein